MSDRLAPRRSLWIPWTFVGLMLLVVVVNGGLIYAALSTFTGVTVGKAYDKGRAYNDVLQEAARQEALGWQPEVVLSGGMLRVTVRDAEGLPVAGRLDGYLQRPLEGTEVALDLGAIAAGQWLAAVAPPKPGQWEARLRLTTAEGNRLDIRQRVLAP